MKKYKTYLFDFDGTLFDTLKSLYPVYRYGFEAIGMDCSEEQASHYIHISLTQTAAERHVDAKLWPMFLQAVRDGLDREESMELIEIFPDTLQTIRTLKASGVKIGIVSGNNESHMIKVLQRFGIADLFDEWTGNESFTHPKPDAEPCLVAMKKLKIVASDDIIYIGDSLQDIESGHNAKIDAVLVDRTNQYPSFKGEKINSLLELIK